MVQLRSKRTVRDNSGVREVRTIQVQRGKYNDGRIGDFIVASATKVRPGSGYKKGDIVRGVRVCTKKGVRRKGGVSIRFSENGRIIRNKKGEPVGTRAVGVVPQELRDKGYLKLVAITSDTV